MQNKTKNKIKTLCTIDTTDIDLHEGRNQGLRMIPPGKGNGIPPHSKLSISKNKYMESPCLRKSEIKAATPSRKSTKYFMNTFNGRQTLGGSPGNKSKNKSKSLLNGTLSKSKSRVKTDYSTSNDLIFKSILSKSSSKTLKNRLSNPLDQTYNFETYQILQELPAPLINNKKAQKWYLGKKQDKLYLLKKTKDSALKQKYENEADLKNKLSNTNIKWRNLQKLIKIYAERSWVYSIYDYNGLYLSWENESHVQVIGKILKNDGVVLKHIIKEVAKGINELSSKGYTHGRIQLQNICMKIYEQRTTIKVEGNVKLSNLCYSFPIKEKQKLLDLENTIYTPPEIINLKLFNRKEKFDRELIEYISYYDEPWYADVWGLGVLILELIAGQPISIQKAGKTNRHSVSIECESSSEELVSMESKFKKQSQSSSKKEKENQITLTDILEAQKSILLQTEVQMEVISFDKNLQKLLVRMLSVNPLTRPSPKEIIKDL